MIARLFLAVCALGLSSAAAAQDTDISLTRLDCGRATEPWPLASFDDTGGHDGVARALTSSCYLIRHDEQLLVWDTGIDPAKSGDPDGGITLDRTLVEQLAELGIAPADVDYVGISHYHYDHVGQARAFPQATLLIGTADWAVIRDGSPWVDRALFIPWLDDNGTVREIGGDLDLFGDGTVRLLSMPGHTGGHHALLVRLPETGPVMLSGNLAHFTANYENEGVPAFNDDRADSLASFDRFKRMADHYAATVIIQHEPDDIDKLPLFPQAAR